MEPKKIELNQTTYYELLVSCPVCFDSGVRTEKSNWLHQNCGGIIYVGDNACCYCDGCKKEFSYFLLSFKCPTHANCIGNFISTNCTGSTALCTVGMMVNHTGVAWLNTFLNNLK